MSPKPPDVIIYCKKYKCRIAAKMCAERQKQQYGRWSGEIQMKKIPRDEFCISGKCEQGRAVIAAMKEGNMKSIETSPAQSVKAPEPTAKPANAPAAKNCGICHRTLPNTEDNFRLSKKTGRLVSTCASCEKKYGADRNNTPKRSGRAATALKKKEKARPSASLNSTNAPIEVSDLPPDFELTPGRIEPIVPIVPPGFELVLGDEVCLEFISVGKKELLLSAGVLRAIGKPTRCDIFFNSKTRQIGLRAAENSGAVLCYKTGTAVAACKLVIDQYRLPPKKRLPVDTLPGGFVSTREGDL